jgi:dGTPase
MAHAKVQNPPQKAENGPAGRLLGTKFSLPERRATYATNWETSRGRFFPEQESATRTCYQRDRDRIIHSAAFRRLKHKTQVFIREEGDYYRTRLTHSLEVAQIARSLARVLALDEDLAETLALAHDLGHTPFGHAGEEALSQASASVGGFDHNAHALRLVTKLEHRYAAFDGLNLTWETLEGLVKHNGPLKPPLSAPIASFDARWSLEPSSWPGLEAQLASLADDIAYLNHDIDDGLRAHLFVPDDLKDVPLAGPSAAALIKAHNPALELGRFIGELVRTLIGALVEDLVEETRRKLDAVRPATVGAVRACGLPLAAFSIATQEKLVGLRAFLFARMYRHPRVLGSVEKAKAVVGALFEALSADPMLLPGDWTEACGAPRDAATQGVVRDYIAGMTDRFALSEYRRIFHEEVAL